MLRSQLLQMEHVLFAGYKVPHPLEPRFIIKIQTTAESTPIQAVQEACTALITLLARIKDELQREFDTAKAMGTVAPPTALGVQAQYGQTSTRPADGIQPEGIYGATAANPYDAEGIPASGFSEFI